MADENLDSIVQEQLQAKKEETNPGRKKEKVFSEHGEKDSYHLGGGIWGWREYDGVTGEYFIGDSMKNVP